MEQEIVNRIKHLIKGSGLSVNSFARKIDVYPQTLYKCVGGRIPAVELLQKILTTYPDISAEWLLMGKGEMKRLDTTFFEEQIKVKDDLIKMLVDRMQLS